MINENKVKELLTLDASIIAATKYGDKEDIKHLYDLGIRNVGENRDKSFLEKYEELSNLDIKWHFIGTLQTKKVKSLINKIDYLHSLDSIKLANEINKYRVKPLECFIEVNISKEETKEGIFVEDLDFFIEELKKYDKIKVVGLMTMAPNTDDIEIISNCFYQLSLLKDKYNC